MDQGFEVWRSRVVRSILHATPPVELVDIAALQAVLLAVAQPERICGEYDGLHIGQGIQRQNRVTLRNHSGRTLKLRPKRETNPLPDHRRCNTQCCLLLHIGARGLRCRGLLLVPFEERGLICWSYWRKGMATHGHCRRSTSRLQRGGGRIVQHDLVAIVTRRLGHECGRRMKMKTLGRLRHSKRSYKTAS